ncbi:helix-turn-helix transcriptional regulator [Streptomyces sp. NPDC096323]|uniref:helix-turn-helix domain-containing protein n=1 Tax=Streptomyces sp. NPDC096323 TaxID=3155822 RepID=UPI00331746F3
MPSTPADLRLREAALPPRRFDGAKLRTARRGADLSQIQVARGLGLSAHVAVARWEKEERFPPAEKLVAIASILGVAVDVLFPREGPCDLADLRCDAGYTQSAAAEEVKGLNRFALGDAEGGRRRLDGHLVAPLARLYGVSPHELQAAQDLSFGVPAPLGAPPQPPQLAEKLTGLVNKAFRAGDPPPEVLADAINAKVGTRITAEQVAALRGGTPAADVFADGTAAVALTGIAAFFGISELFLEDTADVERRVLGDLQFLAAQHDIALAARGGDGGVSPAMLAVLNDLVARAPE